jgi:acid phosphatase
MDENLYPNTACRRLRTLDATSIKLAASAYNPELATLDRVLVPVLGGTGLRIDSTPRANGVLDTLMVCRAHGIKVPSVFEDTKVLRVLETGVVHEWSAFPPPISARIAVSVG